VVPKKQRKLLYIDNDKHPPLEVTGYYDKVSSTILSDNNGLIVFLSKYRYSPSYFKPDGVDLGHYDIMQEESPIQIEIAYNSARN
jgi:hypothetical protein